jgi:dissimilatory sulfite reductase (desulfoviridin) alpha/beta subunit
VVMKHMKRLTELYIGGKINEKKAWLMWSFIPIFWYKKWEKILNWVK